MNQVDKPDTDNQQRQCRVVADHRASYPDPISMRAGDKLELSGKVDYWQGRPDWAFTWCTNQQGKSGWVPKSFVDQQGDKGVALFDYNAIELTANTGETLRVEQEESGWMWCTNQQGKSGWIPISHIEY